MNMTPLKHKTTSSIKWLIIITILIIASNIINLTVGEWSWRFYRLMDTDGESNFPAWFSSFLLVLAAGLAYQCSLAAKDKQAEREGWQFLVFGLLYMSCDEVAMLHENIGLLIKKYLFQAENLKWFSGEIILVPFAVFFIAVIAVKLRNYLKGSRRAIRFLLAGALVYAFGAFVLDSVINFITTDIDSWLFKIESLLEESLEMFGVILVIKGLLEHLRIMQAGLLQSPSHRLWKDVRTRTVWGHLPNSEMSACPRKSRPTIFLNQAGI